MKLILGDNQFFGINHVSLKKGEQTRSLFSEKENIVEFIEAALDLGLDGYMINSNDLGFQVANTVDHSQSDTECHYSIPYPHKYASLVNESGVLALLTLVLRKLKICDMLRASRFLVTRNAISLLPVIIRMEIPPGLPRGSFVYLQNIITDLTLGLNNCTEVLGSYIRNIQKMGYKPGLITLNPTVLFEKLGKDYCEEKLSICFNSNINGFNVFPSQAAVEAVTEKIKRKTSWDTMAMSIFSSGGFGKGISESINYIKNQNFDRVVFGSSNLKNIKENISNFKAKKS